MHSFLGILQGKMKMTGSFHLLYNLCWRHWKLWHI